MTTSKKPKLRVLLQAKHKNGYRSPYMVFDGATMEDAKAEAEAAKVTHPLAVFGEEVWKFYINEKTY